MMHTARDCKYFNPRSRVGNDFNQFGIEFFRTISIHVPAWGTTEMKQLADIAMKFQSTFPRGERLNVMDVWIKLSVFQSTFPRGERLNIRTENICAVNFNPRSRVGNDDIISRVKATKSISIHVPAWGTTEMGVTFSNIKNISIHVPAWGTTERNAILVMFQEFQSTFPRGERLSAYQQW